MSRRLAHNSQKYPGDYFNLDGKPLGTIKKYSSEIVTDAGLEWLEQRDSKRPFFLYLPYDADRGNDRGLAILEELKFHPS